MSQATVNDLIQVSGQGVDQHSLGTVYEYAAPTNQNGLLQVLDGIEFNLPDDAVPGTIPAGSTTVIDGVEYTLTEVYNFWGSFEKVDPDTHETYFDEGQTLALTLEDHNGHQINFLAPADDFTKSHAWSDDPISAVCVNSVPTQAYGNQINEGSDGHVNKLAHDDDVTVPCFTAGTLVTTAEGDVLIEDLSIGDRVQTRDNGFKPVRWIGKRTVTVSEQNDHKFTPVQIKAGALGAGQPVRDTYVSPWHRLLMCGQKAELMFGEREVLVPAITLVGYQGFDQVVREITYVHVMFDVHQIIFADGAWSESFLPGPRTLPGIEEQQRSELLALFPELATIAGQQQYPSARMVLQGHEVTALMTA